MTTEQLQQLAQLTTTARDVVAQLRVIAAAAPACEQTASIIKVLGSLRADVALLTNRVQDAHAKAWIQANPPRPPKPVTSSDVPHGVHVRKYDANGTPKTEAKSAPPALSGKWQIGTLGQSKPRSRDRDTTAASEDR